jgi:hypothetical protein
VINVDDLTVGQLKELTRLAGCSTPKANPYTPFLGKAVFIRTVTHHHTGRLVEVADSELVLEDAAWIADDGRFSGALASGKLNEVEPFPGGRVVIGRGAVIDCCAWEHALPRELK